MNVLNSRRRIYVALALLLLVVLGAAWLATSLNDTGYPRASKATEASYLKAVKPFKWSATNAERLSYGYGLCRDLEAGVPDSKINTAKGASGYIALFIVEDAKRLCPNEPGWAELLP